MDELFRDSPTFVPGSKWKPSSHIDMDAKEIAEHEAYMGMAKGYTAEQVAAKHVEDVVNGTS